MLYCHLTYLRMALVRFSSEGVAIRFVLPVLRMTSFFSHNGPMARHVYSSAAIEYDKHNSRDSNQILLVDKDQQVLIAYT